MNLKAIATKTLIRLHGDGTDHGQRLEQVEQQESCSTAPRSCSNPLEHESPQKSDPNGPCSIVPRSMKRNSGTPALPPEIVMGLNRLRGMRAAHIKRPEVWPEIVADALRISSEGWAVAALRLGWSPLELWGWSPDREGLAVWLAGRRLVIVDDAMAIVRVGNMRCVFNRWDSQDARFLWELPAPCQHKAKFDD